MDERRDDQVFARAFAAGGEGGLGGFGGGRPGAALPGAGMEAGAGGYPASAVSMGGGDPRGLEGAGEPYGEEGGMEAHPEAVLRAVAEHLEVWGSQLQAWEEALGEREGELMAVVQGLQQGGVEMPGMPVPQYAGGGVVCGPEGCFAGPGGEAGYEGGYGGAYGGAYGVPHGAGYGVPYGMPPGQMGGYGAAGCGPMGCGPDDALIASGVAMYGADFERFIAALIRRYVQEAAAPLVQGLEQRLYELALATDAELDSLHMGILDALVEGLEEIQTDPRFLEWIGGLPAKERRRAERVVASGTVGQVKRLVEQYVAEQTEVAGRAAEDWWAAEAATGVRGNGPIRLPGRVGRSEQDEFARAFELG